MSTTYDILGWDEILGADAAALLGAKIPDIGVDSGAAKLALAQKLAQTKKILTSRGPTRSRELVLGFDSGAVLIAAGAAGNIAQNPQVPFKGTRLAVAASIAANFVITDIRVGKDSQLVAAGNMPAETFGQTAQGMQIDLDTCQVSMQIRLDFTNIALAPARFLATIVGSAVM